MQEYKDSGMASARNLRAGRSERGKATRKKYANSVKGKASAARCRVRRASKAEIRIQNSMHEQLRRMMRSTWYESNLLGVMQCSREQLIGHFEELMEPGMTWENYGYKHGHQCGWDVDHIIPKSEYDHNDAEDRRRCWSFGNLRPMWHTENLAKSNKLVPEDYEQVPRLLWPKKWTSLSTAEIRKPPF